MVEDGIDWKFYIFKGHDYVLSSNEFCVFYVGNLCISESCLYTLYVKTKYIIIYNNGQHIYSRAKTLWSVVCRDNGNYTKM